MLYALVLLTLFNNSEYYFYRQYDSLLMCEMEAEFMNIHRAKRGATGSSIVCRRVKR